MHGSETDWTPDLEALRDEMDRLTKEVGELQVLLTEKMQRRSMIGEFLALADKLKVAPPPTSVPLPMQPVTSTGVLLYPVRSEAWPKSIESGVLDILGEGGEWGPHALAVEMARRGWRTKAAHPDTVIGNTLTTLHKKGRVTKPGYGTYAIVKEDVSP